MRSDEGVGLVVSWSRNSFPSRLVSCSNFSRPGFSWLRASRLTAYLSLSCSARADSFILSFAVLRSGLGNCGLALCRSCCSGKSLVLRKKRKTAFDWLKNMSLQKNIPSNVLEADFGVETAYFIAQKKGCLWQLVSATSETK